MNKFVGTCAVFVLCVLSYAIGSVGEEPYDQPVHTVTKTVYKDRVHVKTKSVPVQARACTDLATVVRRVLTAVAAYDAVLGREKRIQDESYHASVDGTQAERNKVIEDHRKILRDTLDAALELQEAQKDLENADRECRKYPVK